jgi:hypothetical protein
VARLVGLAEVFFIFLSLTRCCAAGADNAYQFVATVGKENRKQSIFGRSPEQQQAIAP